MWPRVPGETRWPAVRSYPQHVLLKIRKHAPSSDGTIQLERVLAAQILDPLTVQVQQACGGGLSTLAATQSSR
jgi:hypothetical protein